MTKTTSPWWHPDRFARQRPYLETRMRVIKAIRAFFDAQGFAEVETPVLQVCPVMDTHIHGFGTDLIGVDLQFKKRLYLHTSPEFAMKKLLVAGMPAIYQICHVFRNAEGSTRHSPEFTMLEWYRAGAGYDEIAADTVGLLRACAQAAGVTHFRYKDFACDAFAEAEYLSVRDAFVKYAGIDLDLYLTDRDGFAAVIAAQGIRVADDDRWDDLFFRVMAEKIEPVLGMSVPTILKDYPISMASLARPCPHDPRYAARFEVYVCGIELANAFDELTDADIQQQRFVDEMAQKERIYGATYPVDEDFIAALRHGMPPSGGIALGVDRLVMLAAGVDDIAQVLWAPVDSE
ncbi:MAG: EF-P lysine aminoacylase GenX [Alphaproteobacteria bacterium]|nr:EF-P lysine aminoacylase GenX [Alphaproteobacteria bacterium]